jgi:hypothetical protein
MSSRRICIKLRFLVMVKNLTVRWRDLGLMGSHMVFVHGEEKLPGVSEHSHMENCMEALFGLK